MSEPAYDQHKADEALIMEQNRMILLQRQELEQLSVQWKEAVEGWEECTVLLHRAITELREAHQQIARAEAERDEFEMRIGEML